MLLILSAWSSFSAEKDLTITFIKVGHGDAIFIEFPNKTNMLLDAGKEGKVSQHILPLLERRNIEKIDYLVISHNHKDHIGGCSIILKNYKVGQIWKNGEVFDSKYYRRCEKAARKRDISQKILNLDEEIRVGDVLIHVLNTGIDSDEENDNSIVLKLKYGDFTALFTGDIEKDVSRRLYREYGPYLKSKVYKVSHHGTKKIYKPFVKMVDPDYSFICGSDQDYSRSVEKRELLEELGSEVYSTSRNGNIVVKTDGFKIKIDP